MATTRKPPFEFIFDGKTLRLTVKGPEVLGKIRKGKFRQISLPGDDWEIQIPTIRKTKTRRSR